MSNTSSEISSSNTCANCGKEGDSLKSSAACKLVKYCSRDCQASHRPQHKKECKRRAAELHDEKLFKQPPPKEDCPICFLSMPILGTGWRYQTCCGKVICSGCFYSRVYDDQGNEVDHDKCPFCRTLNPASNEEELLERMKKRVEAGDLIAIYDLGCNYRDGTDGYPQNYTKALELHHRAAELGYARAYTNIGTAYYNGEGVEIDKEKAIHYFELAAMGGDVIARNNLGATNQNEGNMDRALKHWMIAVRSGHNNSVSRIKDLYSNGHAAKED